MAKTSTFLQTGAQSTTLAQCWHPITRFVKAIDLDSANIAQGQQVRCTESVKGRRFVQTEPDARHVELVLKSLGLLKSSIAVSTPGTRQSDDSKGDHSVPTLRDASKLSLTTPCGLWRSCEQSCSPDVQTICEFDGRSREIGTSFFWQAIFGFGK